MTLSPLAGKPAPKDLLVDPARLFAANGGDEEATAAHMVELARERIRAALAGQTLAADVSENHAGIGTQHADALRGAAEQLGVEFVDLQLDRIVLPEDELAEVYQRMQQSLTAQAQQIHAQGSAEAGQEPQ